MAAVAMDLDAQISILDRDNIFILLYSTASSPILGTT
jgi:hypothetical protein